MLILITLIHNFRLKNGVKYLKENLPATVDQIDLSEEFDDEYEPDEMEEKYESDKLIFQQIDTSKIGEPDTYEKEYSSR